MDTYVIVILLNEVQDLHSGHSANSSRRSLLSTAECSVYPEEQVMLGSSQMTLFPQFSLNSCIRTHGSISGLEGKAMVTRQRDVVTPVP